MDPSPLRAHSVKLLQSLNENSPLATQKRNSMKSPLRFRVGTQQRAGRASSDASIPTPPRRLVSSEDRRVGASEDPVHRLLSNTDHGACPGLAEFLLPFSHFYNILSSSPPPDFCYKIGLKVFPPETAKNPRWGGGELPTVRSPQRRQ